MNELFAINCCRIFHGLIYPSEMSNYDGATINKNFLNGRYSKRNTKHQNWPNQPCPTDYQWQIWREFVYRRYLISNKQQFQQRYSPSNAIRHQDITPNEKLEQIHKETPRNLEYKQYIFKLPYKYQQYLEYWKGGEDEIKKIWDQLYRNTIQIATDGSHIPETEQGAGSAVFSILNMDNPLVITGAKCTIIEGMTSLHTEQWGIISALLTIHILCMKFGMPTKRVQITHWIDNEEALRRITTTATDDLRLKSYGVRDYSDMTIMRELNEKLPKTIQIEYLKVKSHQIIGPDDETPHEVYINNVADEYANYINSTIIRPQNIYHMSTHEGILIRDDSGRAIHDIAKYI